jgi:hypothetical protein
LAKQELIPIQYVQDYEGKWVFRCYFDGTLYSELEIMLNHLKYLHGVDIHNSDDPSSDRKKENKVSIRPHEICLDCWDNGYRGPITNWDTHIQALHDGKNPRNEGK